MRGSSSHDPWITAALAVGTLLLLANLGNGRLWQDEAETAVLGRSILRVGYPCAFDGVNRLNPALPVQEGSAWTYHSWLPFYLVAASFWALGFTTVAARLPCALLGVASVWLGVRLAARWTRDLLVTRLTALFLATSVPFILHMRQCRYYSPAVFFTLWTVWAYWRFYSKRRLASLELIGALTFLFHADHGVFLPVLIACGIHFSSTRPGVEAWHRWGKVLVTTLALTTPWVIYLQAGQHHKAFSFIELRHHLEFYFRQINRFLFPVGFWALVVLWRRPGLSTLCGERGTPVRTAWGLVGCVLLAGIFFLILVPEQRHFRYLIFLIPFLGMVQAALLAQVLRKRFVIGIGLTATLILTDFLHYSGPSVLVAHLPGLKLRHPSQARIRSLPMEFLGELTHSYQGPIDGIVEYLQSHSTAGQTVKTPPAEDHPLLFYTNLVIEPMASLSEFGRETYPHWIILRRDWLPNGFLESAYFSRIQQRYERIVLDAPDIPWQNRPDPGYHRFLTDRRAPSVTVFKRKS